MPEAFTNFLIFYAPFLVLIALIAAAFVVAPMDGNVVRKEGKRAGRDRKKRN